MFNLPRLFPKEVVAKMCFKGKIEKSLSGRDYGIDGIIELFDEINAQFE